MRTPLGEACEFIRGVTFSSGEGQKEKADGYVACLTTSGVQAEVAWSSRRFIPQKRVHKSRQMLRKGDILISTANSKELVGKSCIVHSVIFPCTFGAFVTVARSNNSTYPPYLAYLMQSKGFMTWCYHASSNTTNISNLRISELNELPILLPALDEQRRISALLDNVDRLRHTRRYTQHLSEAFLQSVFLEMFGDPVINPKGWKKIRIRDTATRISDGPFGSDLKSSHYRDSGVRVLRLQNIGVGELIDNDRAYISREHFDSLIQHRCLPGDVIVGTMGDPNLRACVLPPSIHEALNKADCVQIRPNLACVYPEYLCCLLNLPGTLLLASGMILGQTRSRISMGRLAELILPIAPLNEQERFVTIVHRVERLRQQQAEATRQADHLFGSLLHLEFERENDPTVSSAQDTRTAIVSR